MVGSVHRFKADIGEHLTAQINQLYASSTIREALEDIYDGDPEKRLDSDMLILRLPVDQPWDQPVVDAAVSGEITDELRKFLGADDLKAAFERANDRPVYLLGFSGQGIVLSANINRTYGVDVLAESALTPAEIIAQLQKAELECLLIRSRALITSAQGTVFRAPSGRLVPNFIRVGNIQYDRDAIDAVSFWLLPHMRTAAAILTDTWSISSIAFNTARIAAVHFDTEAARVELLPDYIQTSEDAKKRARQIIERLVQEAPTHADRGEVLCLVSATQSGSLQQRLDEVAREPLGAILPRFVAIFALGPTGMDSLLDLSGDVRFKLLPAAESDAEPNRPIPIDPKVYFPLEFHDFVHEVKKPQAEASKEVMNALANSCLIRLHCDVDEYMRPRHHAIHLETARLLDIPLFIERLDVAAASVAVAPIAIVSSPAEGAMAIASHVAKQLQGRELPSEVFQHANLFFAEGALLTDEQEKLRKSIQDATEDDSIVIVVDAWLNDASLSQFQRSLRTERFKGRIHYIVGVARPPDLAIWERSALRLRHRNHSQQHTVSAALELPLPDWKDKNCPWCAELKLYQNWAQRSPLPEELSQRRDDLSEARAIGLTKEFALGLPGLPTMKLGPQSFYVREDSSQVDAFAAVSSALQRLRSVSHKNGPPLGPRHFPTATVLNHSDYLIETWTDSVLRAVFLRAATAEELIYTDAEREAGRTDKLRSLLMDQSPGQHDVALEILLAVALGKASLEIDQPLRDGLANLGATGLIKYMLDMIAQDQALRSGVATVADDVAEEAV